MPSAPASSAFLVSSRLSSVEYVPVPQMIWPFPRAASAHARNSSAFSSDVSVGASPVDPAITRASDPCSRRWTASS